MKEKKFFNISSFWLTISLILITYVFYKDFITPSNEDYYYKYYIITLTLGIFSLFSFFIKKNIKKKIFFFSIIILGFLYLFEGSIFLKDYLYNKNEGNGKFTYFENYKIDNPNSVLAIDPYHFLKENDQNLMPLSSISNKMTIHCNENGFFSKYKTDRYGFNNPDPQWDKNITDFVLVGDRFAQGDCVNEEQNIAGNLRKLSLNNSVINLGYGGNGPLMEYASLKEYLPLLNAKKVIWLYCETNDLSGDANEGLKQELKNIILLNYLKDETFTQDLKNKQHEIDLKTELKLNDMINSINKAKQYNKFFKFIKLFNTRYYIKLLVDKKNNLKISENQKISEDFKNIVLLAKNFTSMIGSEFYFIYIPDKNRYFDKNFDENKHDYKKIINFLLEKNIKFVDLHNEFFVKEDNPLSYFAKSNELEYTHFNQLGYKMIAEIIFKKTK
jgi:hypothetical protein